MRRVLATIVAVAALVAAGEALSHGWYPYECCSDQDCRPVFDAHRVDGGWESGGRFYPDDITKPSRDENFHSCSSKSRSICFFVPLTT